MAIFADDSKGQLFENPEDYEVEQPVNQNCEYDKSGVSNRQGIPAFTQPAQQKFLQGLD